MDRKLRGLLRRVEQMVKAAKYAKAASSYNPC